MDTKVSAATRVTVVTEGIFVARIQADPELAGVSAVLFDEVHERSLDGDFGLALALDAQAGLRPDLRLVAMSATLDGRRFSSLMGEAPVIESEGRSYPLTLRHLGRAAEARVEDSVCPEPPRSPVPPSGSPTCRPISRSMNSMVRSIRRHSGRRSGETRKDGGESCSPPRSRRPA